MRIWLTDRWGHSFLSCAADWQETRTQSTLECTKSQYIGRRREQKEGKHKRERQRELNHQEQQFGVREQARTPILHISFQIIALLLSHFRHFQCLSKGRSCLAATAGLGANGLARQVDTRGSTARRLGFVALLDLRRHGHEGLLYVGGALGRGLNECNAQGVGKLLWKDRIYQIRKRDWMEQKERIKLPWPDRKTQLSWRSDRTCCRQEACSRSRRRI